MACISFQHITILPYHAISWNFCREKSMFSLLLCRSKRYGYGGSEKFKSSYVSGLEKKDREVFNEILILRNITGRPWTWPVFEVELFWSPTHPKTQNIGGNISCWDTHLALHNYCWRSYRTKHSRYLAGSSQIWRYRALRTITACVVFFERRILIYIFFYKKKLPFNIKTILTIPKKYHIQSFPVWRIELIQNYTSSGKINILLNRLPSPTGKHILEA